MPSTPAPESPTGEANLAPGPAPWPMVNAAGPPTEIVFVRHGEPEWVRGGLNVDDPPLTERGVRQAHRLAERLAGEHFDEILVSPLQRARQTAAPLLAATHRQEVLAPWLQEIRNPVWHGTPVERAEQAFKADRAKAAHLRWEGLDGGESVREFVNRIHQGIGLFLAERGIDRVREDLPVWSERQPGLRILLVAHAGTNAVGFGHLLGLEPVPWEWERFVLGHGSLSRVEALPTGEGITFSLTRLSDVEHLESDIRTR
ncbi:MAG: histidine phosphatase family protein [Acidimicrobiales bacterium]